MVKVSYLIFFISFIALILSGFVLPLPSENLTSFLFIIVYVICAVIFQGIDQIFHLLSILLAIQKVILYFSPGSEKIIVLVQKKVHNNIKFIYYYTLAKDVFLYLGYRYSIGDGREGNNFLAVYIVYSIILYCLLFASSILYIPITLSVRRFSYLPSARFNSPQKYIFWQTIAISIFKIISIILAFLNYSTEKEPDATKLIRTITAFDIIMIPVLIQASYIGSNRRNVQTLMSSFNLRKLLEVLSYRKSRITPALAITDASGQSVL